MKKFLILEIIVGLLLSFGVFVAVQYILKIYFPVSDSETLISGSTSYPLNLGSYKNSQEDVDSKSLCHIGGVTEMVTTKMCNDLKLAITSQKNKDIVVVTQNLDNVIAQYNQISNTVYVENPKKTQDCINYFVAGPNITTPADTGGISGCLQGEQSAIQSAQEPLNRLANQINWYKEYLNKIPNSVENNACFDHGGVNCSYGRGGVGQVICNDGWSQSQAYYLNVKECIDYLISMTSK